MDKEVIKEYSNGEPTIV